MNDKKLRDLRVRAEAFLSQNPDAAKKIAHRDVRDLIKDLQIHQIELERQNEELRKAQVELEISIKRMQATLHESRDTIQAIIDASTESVLLVDTKGTVLAINATAARRLGRSMEETIGQNVYDFFDSDVSNNRRARLNEVIASRRPVHFIDERSGQRYHHSLCPICDPKGNVEKVAIFGQDVTLQYQTMNDLLESESKYRLVVDHATTGIVVTQDGQLKFVNPQAVNLAGYSKAELTSRPFVDFVHPDDRAMVLEYHIRRLKGQDVPQTYYLRISSKDGQTKWLENKGVLITWEDKPATLNFLADISERKLVEDAFRKSESEKAAILDASIDRIRYVDPDLKIIWANKTVSTELGMLPEDIIGRFCYQLSRGRDAPCEGCPTLRARETRRIERAVMYYPREQGTGKERYWDAYSVPIMDEQDEIKGFIQIARDITEQKKAERALQQSEERFKQIIEKAPFGYYRVGKDGLWQYVNAEWERLHGFSRQEIIGQSFELSQPEDLKAQACANVQRALAGQTIKGEFGRRLKDGSFGYHEFSIQPVYQDQEIVAIEGFINDLTDRKQDENLIRNLSQMLMQAQERERRMIAYELHDQIGQNLSTLKLEADMLFDGPAGSLPELREKSVKFSRLIERTIKSVRDLAYDLRPPGLDQMGLLKALEMYCEEFSQTSGMNIDFQAAGMQGFNLDTDSEIHIYRLVQEGLNNIRKHAAAGRTSVKMLGASPNIILRIEDDGKGFDVLARELALDSEKRMGLRSMKERVNLLRGRMEIQSRPMQGTRIVIKLPLMEHSGESEEAHPDY